MPDIRQGMPDISASSKKDRSGPALKGVKKNLPVVTFIVAEGVKLSHSNVTPLVGKLLMLAFR